MNSQTYPSSPLAQALARVLDTGKSQSFTGADARWLIGLLQQEVSDKVYEMQRNIQ